MIHFVHEKHVEYAVAQSFTPGLRRIVARNPSGFTYHGTGTWIVGHGNIAVIDAGPADERHVEAILQATRGETITHQFVTHTHMDHSPAAAMIRRETGARIWASGLRTHAADEDHAFEEGFDSCFRADHTVEHGEIIEGDNWTIEAVATPGHTSNHICYAYLEENTLFSGDHVMGWSTTVIAPPDGNLGDYMKSLNVLLTRDDRIYRPTHGPAITDPGNFVRALIDHRMMRDRQILECVDGGIRTIGSMVEHMYAGLPLSLRPAAGCSVLAHIIRHVEEGRLNCEGPPDLTKEYWR